jgi:hypothetical protein
MIAVIYVKIWDTYYHYTIKNPKPPPPSGVASFNIQAPPGSNLGPKGN